MRPEPYMIAEIGCCHLGNLDRAKYLAQLAKEAGADCVKTQKRNPIECVPKEWHNVPHPNQRFSYGETYLDHRNNLELNQNQHAEFKEFCEDIGITYSTSVWDITSAREIIELDPEFIKVPSACNTDFDLLKVLYDEYEGDVHMSLGMTTLSERKQFLPYYRQKQDSKERASRTVLYHCTSAYPCPFDRLYLNEIPDLTRFCKPNNEHVEYPQMGVGFSNHGYGIAADIAGLALGADYFERHFIDDRTFPHTDASASLEPQGLSRLIRDLKNVHKALQSKPDGLDELEMEQRIKMKKVT